MNTCMAVGDQSVWQAPCCWHYMLCHHLEKGSDDALDVFNASFIKERAGVIVQEQLLLGAVYNNFTIGVRGVLWLGMCAMNIFKNTESGDVLFHAEVACALEIVPGEVYSRKFGSSPVGDDFVGLLQSTEEMVSMALAFILDAKVVNDEKKRVLDTTGVATGQALCGIGSIHVC